MMFKKLKFPRRERRKDLALRKAIDENEKTAEDVRSLAEKVRVATANGDIHWFNMAKLQQEKKGS